MQAFLIKIGDRPCFVVRGNASIVFSGARAKSSKIPPTEGPFGGIDPNPDLFFTNSAQTDPLKPLVALQNLHHLRTINPATVQ
jgi:hypothetical protein